MDNPKEPVKKLKRPKSATRFPKRTNTFVVAFAVQETPIEDIPKTITANKRIPETVKTSSESISVTGSATSTKTFTISPTNDLGHPLVVPTISEVKIDMLDGNQCGDTEKKSPQTNNYEEVDNKMVDEQPQIIFDASKNMKRCKERNRSLRKKPKTYSRVIKFKSIHFKYKNSKNVITRRLEKCYVKAKMNTTKSRQLNKIYSNTISKVISRSRILKNVLAKENLLAGTDPMSMSDITALNENDTLSPESGTILPTSIVSSYGSENTLVNESSFSLQSDDFYSIKTVNSVVPLSTDIPPYNTDVNIAVALAFTPLKASNDLSTYTIPSNEESRDKGNVTSTDTMPFSDMELTSQVPSTDDGTNKTYTEDLILNEKYISSETLAGLKDNQSNIVSDDDTFKMDTTISESDKSSNHSESELTCMSETRIISDNVETKEIKNNVSQRVTLLDTVIHLGFCPEMTPSTSSGANFNSINDVRVKNNLIRSYAPNHKKENLAIQNHLSKNVLKKSFDVETKELRNNISLPNEVAIKAILKNTEKLQKKTCAEELEDKNLPLDMTEVLNRLSIVIDLAVKRLEESITEKIIREINRSLSDIKMGIKEKTRKSDESFSNNQGIKREKCKLNMFHKEVFANADNSRNSNHQAHQCDLVQNQVIDQLMLKLSVENPKTLYTPQISLKSLKKPQIVRDYFDVLKQPIKVEPVDVEVGKGDTVTVSTATAPRSSKKKYHSLKGVRIFSSSLSFFRENLLVITSVPTFFLILFCLYGIVTLIIKPW